MGVSAPAVQANGLPTVVDTIASPTEAFERQRTAPTWGWALLICVVLMIAGALLQAPAARHAAVGQIQHMLGNPKFATLSDAQKQQMIANAGKPSLLTYAGPAVWLLVAVLFNTLFMLLGNLAGRGQADFKRLWCGSMNIAVPTLGIGAVALGIITMLRGADSFNSSAALAQAVPGLGMLVPHAGIVFGTFLAGINIFAVWGFFLNATMLRVTGKTNAAVAYIFAGIVLILGAMVPAIAVAAAHNAGFV